MNIESMTRCRCLLNVVVALAAVAASVQSRVTPLAHRHLVDSVDFAASAFVASDADLYDSIANNSITHIFVTADITMLERTWMEPVWVNRSVVIEGWPADLWPELNR